MARQGGGTGGDGLLVIIYIGIDVVSAEEISHVGGFFHVVGVELPVDEQLVNAVGFRKFAEFEFVSVPDVRRAHELVDVRIVPRLVAQRDEIAVFLRPCAESLRYRNVTAFIDEDEAIDARRFSEMLQRRHP